ALHAARHLRSGKGPMFIEAVTYRLGPHTTSDDPTRSRDEAELRRGRRRCPLGRLERHLAQLGAPVQEVRAEAERRRRAATPPPREAVAALPSPAPETMCEHVLSTEHPGLARQREAFRAFPASLAPEQTEGAAA